MRYPALFFLLFLCLRIVPVFGQSQKIPADKLFYHARIYTVNARFDRADAIVCSAGRILFVGKLKDAKARFAPAEEVDLKGKFVYPGFIDAHCHFVGYARFKAFADLTGATSWKETLDRTEAHAARHPYGWIMGRGWDQNLWQGKAFPTRKLLDIRYPNRPVLLKRVDGHAGIANAAALRLAHFTSQTTIAGGELIQENGQLTGVLLDNALDTLEKLAPPLDATTERLLLAQAQQECLDAGLTAVADAGLDLADVELLKSYDVDGKLKLNVYAMLNPSKENFEKYVLANAPYKQGHVHVQAVKMYADGALGSRGACLLAPYADRPETHGFLLHTQTYFDSIASLCALHHFQLNTHCIGDSAVHTLLRIYAAQGAHAATAMRWRIEHAQIVSTKDMALFGSAHVIPSVQPTHATSDGPWAGTRLGARIATAYTYRTLLKASGTLASGTDFPVEPISPIRTFYAAVFRTTNRTLPAFQPRQAISRKQAMQSMTIWAAYAQFEEDERGSLEFGKLANFTVLDYDLVKGKLPQRFEEVKVNATYIEGIREGGL